MTKLLPQANNLDVLFETFKYCLENPSYTKKELAKKIGYDIRQVDYYLNACIYLDLLDSKGQITNNSLQLLELGDELRLGIYERILNDQLIGKIFSHYLFFPQDIRSFAYQEVLSKYSNYGDAVIKRRVSTILSWCDEIIAFMKFSY